MSMPHADLSQNGDIRTFDTLCAFTGIEECDFSRLLNRPRPLNMDRQRSCDERSLNELSIALSPQPSSRTAEFSSRITDHMEYSFSPGRRSGFNTPRSHIAYEPHPMVAEAWEALRRSLVYFRGQPVGTIAALDNSEEELNYDQVFVRDFVPSALAFLMNGEPEIVKNFLLKTLRLQSWEKKIDRFQLGEGVMPASFKVLHDPVRNSETLMADFGESAIGRVAPVDSGFWWIILLRAYTKSTGDTSLAELPECQKGMRLILSLCLSEGFDTFPTLLCADGCCMIDRRMGVYGYPIEIQALFFMALRCALLLLKQDDEGKEVVERIVKRLHALSFHMRSYFWLDLKQLNDIYRYKTEEYSHTAVNKFNVIPDSLPEWIFDFMPTRGGYFIGNVSPARMDFRWFCMGNCIAILSSLATPEQSIAIMDLIESRWEELVGEMGKIGCNNDGNLDSTKFNQPMPWIGIYVAAASLVCLVGMAADAIHGIRNRKFWFPCKFSSLNATSLTLLAVAVKLSVDLNTSMPGRHDQLAKLSSTVFICTVMGNSMPSLGTMENKDMFMNIIALGILVITVVVNICIQLTTGVIYIFWIEHASIMFIMLVLLLILTFSALTVPTTKQYLEYKYNKKHELALKEGPNDNLRQDVMKYWMMSHTCSPQFVMARSVTCTASGAFCLLSAATLAEAMLRSYFMPWSCKFCSGESDYKWSTTLVLFTQTIGVAVGTIAPACRWFVAINYSCPKRRKQSCRRYREFKVEGYWVQSLVEMKECPLILGGIRGRQYRKLAHDAKKRFLNLCIRVQTGIVIMSKLICLVSIFSVTQILLCCHYCKKLKKKFEFKNELSASESQPCSKLDLSRFVLHLEGEDELVGLMMKCNRDPTDHWIREGDKRRPKYLIELLETSTQGFKGVGEFDSNQVPCLDSEEPPNCWALPVVTLTSIAVALPNISPGLIKGLICSVNEGLTYIRLIDNLDAKEDLANIRRAAEVVWLGVELYHKWLDVDLQKLSLQGKTMKETLQKLSDTAKNRLVEFHKEHNTPQCLKRRPSKWPIKVLAANSMYRITQTMLLKSDSRDCQMSEKLYEAVAVMISDILGACLTNIHNVVYMKCLSSAIEEREESVRHAVSILGKTEKILKLLEKKLALSSIDPCQMTCIDEWRSLYMQKKKSLPLIPSPSESEIASSNSGDLFLTID